MIILLIFFVNVFFFKVTFIYFLFSCKIHFLSNGWGIRVLLGDQNSVYR